VIEKTKPGVPIRMRCRDCGTRTGTRRRGGGYRPAPQC
jgi:hypothetical protein